MSLIRWPKLSSLRCALSICVLGALTLLVSSANALTPLRSPEQIARDEVLFASASRMIASKVSRCFLEMPGGPHRPFKVRFFLSGGGERIAQSAIIEGEASTRPARSARERSAIKAINACAPYSVPEELRTWGGFWVTIAF